MRRSEIVVDNTTFLRIPIKTNIITDECKLNNLLSYTLDYLKPGDVVFVSEKVLSIMQNRIVHLDDIEPGFFAKTLSKYVSNNPGSNLTDPRAMEVAIQEAGKIRIFFAAGLSALTKPFGVKGVFYRVAGDSVRGIDMPDKKTVEGFDKYISLSPISPDKVADEGSNFLDCTVCILDANYRGINILGSSDKELDEELYKKVLHDNPMGQTDEQTPLCIVRELS